MVESMLYIVGIKNSKFSPETLMSATVVPFIMRIGRRFYWSSPITRYCSTDRILSAVKSAVPSDRLRRSWARNSAAVDQLNVDRFEAVSFARQRTASIQPLLRILFHKAKRFMCAHLYLRLRVEKLHWNLMSVDRFSLCMHFRLRNQRRGGSHECNNSSRKKAFDSRSHARKVSGCVDRLYVPAKKNRKREK